MKYETDKVLASTHFLELTVEALLKVVEQQSMNVAEIEVWRAAIKWAKHRTNSDNRQDLRKELERPLKHIRVCAIDDDRFVNEVCPTGILTDKEINMVYFSKVNKKIPDDFISLSNNLESRIKHLFPCELSFDKHINTYTEKPTVLYILTKQYAIELLPFKLKSKCWQHDSFVPSGLTYQFKCTITISRITDYINNTSSEPPVIVEVCQQVGYGKEFCVPVERDGKNIILLSNNKYSLSVESNQTFVRYYTDKTDRYENQCISVLIPFDWKRQYLRSRAPFKTLFYRPIEFYNPSTAVNAVN